MAISLISDAFTSCFSLPLVCSRLSLQLLLELIHLCTLKLVHDGFWLSHVGLGLLDLVLLEAAIVLLLLIVASSHLMTAASASSVSAPVTSVLVGSVGFSEGVEGLEGEGPGHGLLPDVLGLPLAD